MRPQAAAAAALAAADVEAARQMGTIAGSEVPGEERQLAEPNLGAGDFIAAKTPGAGMPGYIFKMGAKGLGFYKDEKSKPTKTNRGEAAGEAERSAAAKSVTSSSPGTSVKECPEHALDEHQLAACHQLPSNPATMFGGYCRRERSCKSDTFCS